jgi:hypothetical protein
LSGKEVKKKENETMSSEGVAFIDHTPAKNAAFVPSDTTAAPRALDSEEAPAGFTGRVMQYVHSVRQYKDERFATLKPWREFFDRTKFSPPGKMEAFSRANRNVAYFYSNYVIVAFCSSLYVLITNPQFMVCMSLALAAYLYMRMKVNINEPVVVFGRPLSNMQAFSLLGIFTLISFYMTGGSSTVFWLVLSSLGTVLCHATFREPPLEQGSFSFV